MVGVYSVHRLLIVADTLSMAVFIVWLSVTLVCVSLVSSADFAALINAVMVGSPMYMLA